MTIVHAKDGVLVLSSPASHKTPIAIIPFHQETIRVALTDLGSKGFVTPTVKSSKYVETIIGTAVRLKSQRRTRYYPRSAMANQCFQVALNGISLTCKKVSPSKILVARVTSP